MNNGRAGKTRWKENESKMKIWIILSLVALDQVCWGRGEVRHRSRQLQRCAKCPPGWGVVQPCTALQDTRCGPCVPRQTYSPHHSYHGGCLQCSRCGVGLYEARACSATRDTVCDDCTRFLHRPRHRQPDLKPLKTLARRDFHLKCSYLFYH